LEDGKNGGKMVSIAIFGDLIQRKIELPPLIPPLTPLTAINRWLSSRPGT
jgi:hypothetical protein